MDSRDTLQRLLNNYLAEIKAAVPNLKVKKLDNGYYLSSTIKGSLACTLELIQSDSAIYIGIDNVDTGYWHTEEYDDIDLFVQMAISALRGEYKFNRSLFGFKEICFQVDDNKWLCTRASDSSNRYHYIKARKGLGS